MNKSGSYAGKVGHGGAQEVKAPFGRSSSPGGKVTRGEDLRAGKKG